MTGEVAGQIYDVSMMGDMLRRLRAKHGKLARHITEATGGAVSTYVVTRVENNKKTVDVDDLDAYAKAFNTDIFGLFDMLQDTYDNYLNDVRLLEC